MNKRLRAFLVLDIFGTRVRAKNAPGLAMVGGESLGDAAQHRGGYGKRN
jgi:hypothetical protein